MTTTEKTVSVPVIWIVIGLVVLAAVAGFFFWLGQKDTIKITAEDKAIAPITEKMMRGESLSPAEQKAWQDRQNELAAGASKFFGQEEKSIAPVAPAELPTEFRTGGWTETIDTQWGKITVKYQLSPAAKGKVATRVAVSETKGLHGYVKNISNGLIDGRLILIYKDANGQILSRNTPQIYLQPGEEDRLGIGMDNIRTIEMSIEM